MSATLRCPKCGHEIDRENPVCAGCGAKLKVKPLKLPETPVVKVPMAATDKGRPLPQPEGYRWVKSDERAPSSFGEAWSRGWKYSFAGRASRKEFWLRQISFVLEGVGVGFVAGLLSGMVGNSLPMLLVWIWMLAAMVPMCALFVRRLHDGGFSGWVGVGRPIAIVLCFVGALIPILFQLGAVSYYAAVRGEDIAFFGGLLSFIQGVVEIVFGVLPGTPGTNKYGPNPYAKTVSTTGADVLPGTGVCQSCGRQLEPGQKFCPGCGKPTVPEKAKCRRCGNELDAGQKFCPHCGTSVAGEAGGVEDEPKPQG